MKQKKYYLLKYIFKNLRTKKLKVSPIAKYVISCNSLKEIPPLLFYCDEDLILSSLKVIPKVDFDILKKYLDEVK